MDAKSIRSEIRTIESIMATALFKQYVEGKLTLENTEIASKLKEIDGQRLALEAMLEMF